MLYPSQPSHIMLYNIYIYIYIHILYISIYLSSTFISRLNHEVHGVRIHMFGEDDWLIWLAIEHSHWWLIPYSWPAVSMAISSQSHATYSAVHVISAHNLGLAGWLDFVSCPKKTRAYQAVRFSWPGWCAIILPAWTYWNSCVILGWFPTYIFEVVCLHVWARLNMEHTSNGNLNGKHVLSVIKLLGIPFSDKPQCCWLYAILSYLNIKCSKALRLSPSIGLIPILPKSHNCWSYPNRPIYYIILYYSIVYYIVLYYIILYYIYIHNIYTYT